MRIVLELSASPREDIEETLRVLSLELEALTLISRDQIARGHAPPLGRIVNGVYQFETLIRYQREPRGPGWVREEWQDAIKTARRGVGDCEDLGTYLAAELQALYSIDAWARIRAFAPRPGRRPHWLMHVDTETSDGVILDPSRALGMRGF